MAEEISLYNIATSSQRDYLLALRNKKVLCPVCEKTSAIFSRQGLHLHYKTVHGNNVFTVANRFWLQAKKLVFKFIFDIFILEMCPKPHKRKK